MYAHNHPFVQSINFKISPFKVLTAFQESAGIEQKFMHLGLALSR